MRFNPKSKLLIASALFTLQLTAQVYPKSDFISPLRIPLYLSGVFGECRATHFHAGMDIKTNGMEGLPVQAIGDGYVSRIKVSAYGYGLALYITHPNGYTSVYGHLREYNTVISQYIKSKQYLKKSFEIDDFPEKGLLKIKKGEFIGASGNTGGSGGPHLHFEIRDSAECIINPQLFGIKIIDQIAPEIRSLAIYNLDNFRFGSPPLVVNCHKGPKGYVPGRDTIKLNSDQLGFALETTDRMNNTEGTNAIYDIKMWADDKLLFEYKMDRFHFDQTRNVLAYVDPALLESIKRKYQRCFVLPNSIFPCFHADANRGILLLQDKAYHQLRWEVSDFQNNTARMSCYVQYNPGIGSFKKQMPSISRIIYPFKAYSFANDALKVLVPSSALFDTLYVVYNRSKAPLPNAYSDMLQLGRSSDPLFSPVDLGIKVNKVPAALQDKLVLVNREDGKNSSCGGRYENGYVLAKTKTLGYFLVLADTTAPQIRPVNLGENKAPEKEIRFIISDNLSGISAYEGTIDGQWKLFEYDAKSGILRYRIDMEREQKEHLLVLKVGDERKNIATYSIKFKY